MAEELRGAAPVGEDRIMALDVLRGIALLGILLVNMRHFAHPAIYAGAAGYVDPGLPWDQAVDFFIATFASGKFFPLFSFLFGIGLAIQLLSWRKKGAPSEKLFTRRLGVLLAIGLAHACFVWAGDILAKFAVLGMLFLVVLPLPTRFLLAGAAVSLACPWLLTYLDADIALAAFMGTPQAPADYQALVNQSLTAYGTGGFVEMTRQRITDFGFRLTAWPYVNGLFTIFAMFCLGAYAGRKQLFRDPDPRLFRTALAVGLMAWLGGSALLLAGAPLPTKLIKLVADLGSVATYVSTVVLLLKAPAWRARLAFLANPGRMALTNYLGQSVLATAFLYGTGLYGQLGSAALLVMALAIYAFQVVVSKRWLADYAFGPVEWLWRWATYGVRPPLRRKPQMAATRELEAA